MNYHPAGIYVWDTWYLHLDGITHCFFLQQLRPGKTPPGVSEIEFSRERGAIGHAVSKDLITWETQPAALFRATEGAIDDYDLWTGCCIEYLGKIYLFYTARNSAEKGTINRIALAISEDGIRWTRYKKNPVITADSRWYCSESDPRNHGRFLWPTVDCRDFCIVADPERDGFWGFFAARQHAEEIAVSAVIGLCFSKDLIHWEQRPPCFAPEKYACIEVPDVFFLNGLWYMICLTGNGYGQRNRAYERNLSGPVTIYAVSEHLEGPYREPDNNILIGSESYQGFAARTVGIEGERYLLYTQAEKLSGSNYGSVSLPTVLRADKDGRLLACWSDRIEKYFSELLIKEDCLNILENNGLWGSHGKWKRDNEILQGSCQNDWSVCALNTAGDNFLYSADILINDARSAGLIFRIQGNNVYEGAYAVILDPSANEVVFTQLVEFPRIETRKWTLQYGIMYNLKILAIDAIINIFIDDVLAIQIYHPSFIKGRFGLFVEQGKAGFTDIKAYRIGENSETQFNSIS